MSWKTPIVQAFWKMVERSDAKIEHIPPKTDMEMITDIPYLPDGAQEHLLDIYYPAGTAGKLPTVINIHGGGLMYGTKQLNTNYNLYIAEYGFTVISLNYSLAPKVTYVQQIQDIMNALAWVKENACKYAQIDTDNVFLTGDSAGGFLAAHCAAVNNSEVLCQYYGTSPSGLDFKAVGFNFGMFKMHEGALAWGIGDSTIGRDYKTKPYLKIEDVTAVAKLPPAWLLSSEEDFIKSSSFYMADLLEKQGCDYEFKFFKKTKEHPLPHVFNVQHPEYKESIEAHDSMVKFFRKHM